MNKKEKIKLFLTELNNFLNKENYFDEVLGKEIIPSDIIGGIIRPLLNLASSGVGIKYEVKGIIDEKFHKYLSPRRYVYGQKMIDEHIFYKKIYGNGIEEIKGISYEEFFYKLTLKYYEYKSIKDFYKKYNVDNVLYIPKILINEKINDLLLYKDLQNKDD